MGLLDDAIREHLELKRLRGADPGAVAREEQDALGSVRREDEAHREEDSEKMSPDADRSSLPDAESTPVDDSPIPGQETIEINMEAELAAYPWFAGEEFTAADVQMSFPLEAAVSRAGLNMLLLDAAEATGKVSIRFGATVSG